MKQILLKTEKISFEENSQIQEVELDYKTHLLLAIEELPHTENGQRPFTLTEIEKRLRLKKIISESSSKVLIEDEDHLYLSHLVKDMKWNILDQKIIDFVNDIVNAESINVNKC